MERGASKFPDAKRLTQVKRAGDLRPGQGRSSKLDHLAFELYEVKPGNAGKLKLRVDAEQGTQSAIALVGRSGSLKQGKVVANLTYLQARRQRRRPPRAASRSSTGSRPSSELRRPTHGRNSAKGSRGFGGDNSNYSLRLCGAAARLLRAAAVRRGRVRRGRSARQLAASDPVLERDDALARGRQVGARDPALARRWERLRRRPSTSLPAKSLRSTPAPVASIAALLGE